MSEGNTQLANHKVEKDGRMQEGGQRWANQLLSSSLLKFGREGETAINVVFYGNWVTWKHDCGSSHISTITPLNETSISTFGYSCNFIRS